MIAFFNETSFVFPYHKNKVKQWVKQIALSEGKKIGDINYIFCDDVYLHKINVQYLQHDTLTDIITFDDTELLRVLAHGILHLCGYKDKTPADSELMRTKEEEKMKLFSL